MTAEEPPLDGYESHELAKLTKKAAKDAEADEETKAVIFPSIEIAETVKPMIKDGVVVMAEGPREVVVVGDETIAEVAETTTEEQTLDLRIGGD